MMITSPSCRAWTLVIVWAEEKLKSAKLKTEK
jgi:hypothetical protein